MSFRALVVSKAEDGTISQAIETLDDARLPDGNVTVKVEHSTLNYKDGLCITGAGGLVRNFPHVPGIDLAGTVEASSDARYKAGDKVVLTGWRVGEVWWGGYAERAKVKGDWLVPLPKGLSTRQAMAVGTAGFTAMLAVMALEQHGLKPGHGEVLVTGAAGGVGSVATAILAKLGHEVAAVTGRPETEDYLKALGATRIVARAELAETTRQRFGAMAGMNIGEDQGRFLKLLVEMTGARTAVEIGTFTGMSALWVARGLGPEGTLHCFDISDEYPAVGRPYWQRAGVDDRIQLHIGPAAERLDDLGDQAIDFAFIDADKAGYASYIEALLPRMSPRGLIVLDNVLWSGMVAGPPAPGDTGALQDLNDHLAGRADLDVLMLTIGDGITLIRKR